MIVNDGATARGTSGADEFVFASNGIAGVSHIKQYGPGDTLVFDGPVTVADGDNGAIITTADGDRVFVAGAFAADLDIRAGAQPGVVNICVMMGQSLVAATTASRAVISTGVPGGWMLDYPSLADDANGPKNTALDRAGVTMAALAESGSETQATGFVEGYRGAGGGDLLVLNVGIGGKSIDYLSNTPAMTNFRAMLADAVACIEAAGYEVGTKPVLLWEQGQAGAGTAAEYKAALAGLIDTVAGDFAAAIPGATLTTVIGQVRDYSRALYSTAQFELAAERADVTIGGTEYAMQRDNPSSGTDYTHLSPQGYHDMGVLNGRAAGLLAAGNEDVPTFVQSVVASGNTLTVHFGGVDGGLNVDLTGGVTELRADPANLGFGLYVADLTPGALPDVIGWDQIDGNTFALHLSGAVAHGVLAIGRAEGDNTFGAALVDGSGDWVPIQYFEF